MGRLSAHLQNSVSVLQMPSKHHKKIFGGFYLILMTLSTQVGFEPGDVCDYLLDGADFGKIVSIRCGLREDFYDDIFFNA